MMVPRFDGDARREFLAAVEYYETCQAGLGRRFRLAVGATIEQICQAPTRFQIVRPPFRRCLVDGFPYAVIYAAMHDHVLIVAVAHGRRRPGYWRSRPGDSR